MAENNEEYTRANPKIAENESYFRPPTIRTPVFALIFSGLLLILSSVCAILAMMFLLLKTNIHQHEFGSETTIAVYASFIKFFTGPIILLSSAIISSVVGYGLLRSARTSIKQVIPAEDYPLLWKMLLENNEEGLNNYIKLSSLRGIIGSFTILGLSGLPLATIALTIIFAVLGVLLRADPTGSILYLILQS